MRTAVLRLLVAGLLGALAPHCLAQSRLLLADRDSDTIWVLKDRDRNGVIDETPAAGELMVFFDANNAAGTPSPLNPNAINARHDGLVIIGDQDSTRRHILALRDLNYDGDAQDAGESMVFADATNASGISFAFPTGVTFDAEGNVVVTNAGNSFGNDGLYRLFDLTSDGDAQDLNEIETIIGVGNFQAPNGPFSPQEAAYLGGIGYLHNSSADLHGVYLFQDVTDDGDADDANEMTVAFDVANASGVPVTAGFALEADRSSLGVLYFQQVTAVPSAGTDQIVRLAPSNVDGDFQDAGEAMISLQTSEGGFTLVDLVSRLDGALYASDNSGNRVILLRDLTDDHDFMDHDERTDFLANSSGLITAARGLAAYACPGDVNRDFEITSSDITAFLGLWFGDLGAGTTLGDFDRSGVTTSADITAFLQAWFAGLELCS